jgi:phosphate transport system ATP-binding protein
MNKVMNSEVSSSTSPSKVIGVSVYSDNAQSVGGNTPAQEMIMECHDLKVHYGSYLAVRDVNLRIHRNEITALIGPSGCGKSTILRCFNRMNDLIPTAKVSGSVIYRGIDLYGPDANAGEVRRRIGMVFQKPNPFPMSIFENVVYPLRIDGQRDKRVLMQVCEQSLRGAALWEEVKDRLYESGLSLSGGQQQRLCIARAIASDPEVLLLDEPCSALDPIATGKIEDLIDRLRGEYSILIVTHNMQQASRISDHTAFMYLGRLVEMAETSTIFTRPTLSETEDYVTGRFG